MKNKKNIKNINWTLYYNNENIKLKKMLTKIDKELQLFLKEKKQNKNIKHKNYSKQKLSKYGKFLLRNGFC